MRAAGADTGGQAARRQKFHQVISAGEVGPNTGPSAEDSV